jgi:hypothetical protein
MLAYAMAKSAVRHIAISHNTWQIELRDNRAEAAFRLDVTG